MLVIMLPCTLSCPYQYLYVHSSTRTISRLTEEATAMKQLLPGVTEDSVLDRTTLTRSILAWDEAISKLREQQRIFKVSLRYTHTHFSCSHVSLSLSLYLYFYL